MSPHLSEKVFYLGKDLVFWEQLKKALSEGQFKLDFSQMTEDEFSSPHLLISSLVEAPPKIILLDFSLPNEEILRLVYNLKSELRTKKVHLVALFNDLQNRVVLKKALTLGIPTALVKALGASEVRESLFDLLNPQRLLKKMEDKNFKLEGHNLLRLGFITPHYLHVESSWRFQVDDEVTLETAIAQELPLPRIFKVVRTGDYNLYSSAKFWQDLEANFFDEKELSVLTRRLETYKRLLDKTPQNRNIRYDISLVENEIDILLKKSVDKELSLPEKIKNWIKFNDKHSRPKRTRVLVIDKKMRVLQEDQDYLDRFGYSIRSFSKIPDEENFLRRLMPGIIAIQSKNDEELRENLEKLVLMIRGEENYAPLIVIFKSDFSGEELKNHLGYTAILVNKKDLSLKKLHDFVEKYEQTGARLCTHGMSHGDLEDRFYLSKYDERSVVSFPFSFEVRKMTERAIIFSSSCPIPEYSVFYIKYPVKMSLTVFKSAGLRSDESLGLIHGISLEEKKQLLDLWKKL